MTYHLQYLTDSRGKQMAVQIPLKEWLIIQKKIKKAEAKKELLDDLSTASKEIRDIESGKKKGKTLSQLLDEL